MNRPKPPHILSRHRKLVKNLAISLLVALILSAGVWFFFPFHSYYAFTESLTHRTAQDATRRFFKDIADNNQPAITKDRATPPEPNEAFSKAAVKVDQTIKSLTARGVVSAKIEDVIWIIDSFPPQITNPDNASDALVTVRVRFRAGDSELLYVRMWDNRPESDKIDGSPFTRDWKVVAIHTQKPDFPYIIGDDSQK